MGARLSLDKSGRLRVVSHTKVNSSLNAQTPADNPGIGGPGAGVAPAGDGAPTVPIDGTMNLFLLASGVAYATYTAKNKLVLKSQ